MAYKHYKSYSAQIRKADHPDKDGKPDLHVHISFNEGQHRRLLGRYRLPTLEPVFYREPELNSREIKFIKDWLSKPEQMSKLQGFLKETLFDMHKIGELANRYGEIIAEKNGDTYITIRVPVSERIR